MGYLFACLFTVYVIYLVRGWRKLGRYAPDSGDAGTEMFITHPVQVLIEDAKTAASWSRDAATRVWSSLSTAGRRRRKIEEVRKKRRTAYDELVALERLVREIREDMSPVQLVEYLNEQGFRHFADMRERMRLSDDKKVNGLIPWMREDERVWRDVTAEEWTLAVTGTYNPVLYQGYLMGQRHEWMNRCSTLRAECVKLDEQIDALEQQLGIEKQPEEPKSKRELLRNLRVRVAEVEAEILTDENAGANGPHRAKADVSSDSTD